MIRICFIILVLQLNLIIGCQSARQTDSHNNKQSTDTLKMIEHLKDMERSKLPYAAADVIATLVELLNGKESTVLKIKINTVNGYGQGAPPLAPGTIISAYIRNELLKKWSDTTNNSFENREITALLIHQNQMNINGESIPEWEIIRIDNIP